MNLKEYDYELPKEMIAQKAVHPHDSCKLMVVDSDGKISHHIFYELVDYLKKGDVLVVNETKVRHCKLIGNRTTGTEMEVVILSDAVDAKLSKYTNKLNTYRCKLKGRNPKAGDVIIFQDNSAEILEQIDEDFILKFKQKLSEDKLQLLLPPYIKKNVPDKDYQTIFCKNNGSLAAPTASLHFTEELMQKIKNKGVIIAKLTLHISYATFYAVDRLQGKTGEEYVILSKETADIINKAINDKRRIIAVGTTVVKALESSPFDRKTKHIISWEGNSTLFIQPGHVFKCPISAMITNFHLPKSSLLLLTSAFAGKERLMKAYDNAIKNDYRFYSLGDAMMLFKG